jgi:hypothetical protein
VAPKLVGLGEADIEVALDVQEDRLIERAVLQMEGLPLVTEVFGDPLFLPGKYPRPLAHARHWIVDQGYAEFGAALAVHVFDGPHDIDAQQGVRVGHEGRLDHGHRLHAAALNQAVKSLFTDDGIGMQPSVVSEFVIGAGFQTDGDSTDSFAKSNDRLTDTRHTKGGQSIGNIRCNVGHRQFLLMLAL